MTIKGYLQSPLPDYYMGSDMDMPARPNIRHPGSGSIPAEGMALAGGTLVKTDRAGYGGSGFVTFPQTGGSAEFKVDGGAGGAKTIKIRYANGAPTPRTGVLKVNGVAQKVVFNITGSFDKWTTLSVPVSLAAGLNNTLRLESTGQFLANVDDVTVP
jgi:hypothetical protein